MARKQYVPRKEYLAVYSDKVHSDMERRIEGSPKIFWAKNDLDASHAAQEQQFRDGFGKLEYVVEVAKHVSLRWHDDLKSRIS